MILPPNILGIANTEYGPMVVLKTDRPRGWNLLTARRSDDEAEIHLLCDILKKVTEGDRPVAIDVGANMGSFTMGFARAGAVVFAIEPQPLLCNILNANIMLNDLSEVEVWEMALGKERGVIQVPIYDYSKQADFGCLELGTPTDGPQVGQTPQHYTESIVRTLDSMFEFLPDLHVLKIDVEGMEMDVLLGGESLIRKTKPAILVEWHKSDRRAMESLLDSWGYAITPRGRDLFCQPRKAR